MIAPKPPRPPTPSKPSDFAQLRAGDLFAGRYRIEALLGKGGMGTVYRASLGAYQFAVKVRQSAAHEAVVRFAREELPGVASPRLCRVYERGETQAGISYLVMELIPGRSLSKVLRERRLSTLEIIFVACQLAEALQVLHAHGLVHRDISPDNVMLVEDHVPSLKLLDFGLVKTPDGAELTNVVHDGPTILGKVRWMSEQQLAAPHDADVRDDLFSVGAILYYCLSGQKPYHGYVEADVLALRVRRAAPQRLGVALDARWRSIIQRLMAARREDRFQNPAELLAAIQAEFPGEAPPRPRPVATPNLLKKKPLPRWVVVCISAALGGVLALGSSCASQP